MTTFNFLALAPVVILGGVILYLFVSGFKRKKETFTLQPGTYEAFNRPFTKPTERVFMHKETGAFKVSTGDKSAMIMSTKKEYELLGNL